MCAGVSQVPGEAVCGRGLAVVLSCVDRGCDGVCASLVDCLGCVGGFFEVGQVGADVAFGAGDGEGLSVVRQNSR